MIAAVFGGSFNPPHVAHQLACLYVLETQPVDAVWVVPCFRHPFEKTLAPFDDRLEMCRRAMAPLGTRVEVLDVEREIGGEASLTLVTLQELARRRPDASFRLMLGADLLAEREKWYRWGEVERLAPPLLLGRRGHARPSGVEVELPEVSSTAIRERLGAGQAVDGLVPRSVSSYIRERALYRS